MTDKSSLLGFQNSKLQAQLEEKRREHRLLQDKLASFEGKEQEYARTLLCVNRLWTELSQDLQHLCTTAALPLVPDDSGDRNGGVGPAATLPASITDPFLRCLLAGADARSIKEVADACKQMERDQCDVEQRLTARANSTKEHLARLLQHVGRMQQQEQQQQQQEVKQEQQQAPEQQHHQHQQQAVTISRLQAQVNKQVAQHRTLTAQLQASDDRWLEGQELIKKLQNELADAEQELSNAQRKLFTMRSSSDLAAKEAAAASAQQQHQQQQLPPTPFGSAPAGTPGTATPGPASAAAVPMAVDVADELQELQALLQKRTGELDNERELRLKTSRSGEGEEGGCGQQCVHGQVHSAE